MTTVRLDPLINLLSFCALVRWFDRELLETVAGRASEVAALLASDLVEPAAGTRGAYRLRADVSQAAIAHLRAERPLDELAIQICAFFVFLERMQRHASGERRRSAEAACFEHLGELRLLLSEQRDWSQLTSYVAAARAARPREPGHLHQLAFHEGFIAIRTQQYERGEGVLVRLLDQDDLADDLRIRVLNTLGTAAFYQTHYDRARDHYQRAYDLALQRDDRSYQGHTLMNLSMVCEEIGDYTQALELAERSLEIFHDLGDAFREAHALYVVGHNAMHLGRWDLAAEHFDRAIRMHEKLDIKAGLANLCWSQGLLSHMLGDEQRSEAIYRSGLAYAESPDHGDPSVAMDLHLYLGFLFLTQQRYTEALDEYDRAVPLARQIRNRHALAMIQYRQGDTHRLMGRPDAALEQYRQAIETIDSLRGALASEEIKIGLLGTTQQVYEAAVLLCLEQGRAAEAFAVVERARARAFLDTLALKDPELFAAFDQPVVTLAEVQAQLPANAVLLEYFTTGVVPRDEQLAVGSAGYNISRIPAGNSRLRAHLTLPPHCLLFALSRDRFDVHRIALDPNRLRPQRHDAGPVRRFLSERRLAALYEQLITPVADLLAGRDVVYLAPHGPLHSVPFSALRSETGAYLLASDGPALAYAPSATVLLRNCFGRPASAAAGLLALGYNDRGGAGLLLAEAEARHIARVVGGQAWTGPEPKRARLAAEGRSARWLHIAGHAVFHPQDPLGSAVQLGAGDALSARAIIRGLELEADLVTLSACTSGLSQVAHGDELLGLQRALLYAGAPTVIGALWEAADLATLLVMERFYAELQAGASPAAALRDALIGVRELSGRAIAAAIDRLRVEEPVVGTLPRVPPDQLDRRPLADPFYWAPFILIGRG